MSQVQSIGSETPDRTANVRAAIARAAQASGVDFSYLLAQARMESGLDPAARAATSSASGLYQFTNATWMQTLARHGAEAGLPWVTDPSRRAEAMALRFDPEVSSLMAASLAGDNKAALTTSLGHEPDAAELYLAHFLGPDGASRFLDALAADPSQSAAALLPAAAGANRGIFLRADGSARSVSEVMGLVRSRLFAAMEGEGDAFPAIAASSAAASQTVPAGPVAQAFHAAAAQASPLPGAPQASMAQVLEQAFALGSPEASSTLPAHVRSAYARLSALGL